MKSILDRSFRYTPASKTDIRVTFRKAQRELDEKKKREAAKVRPMVIVPGRS